MPRSLPLLLTCAFACLASACDRQTTPPAQPKETAAAVDTEQLTGKLDRSHAGSAMPALALKDPTGKAFDASALNGKPVLVNLWATWCAPCVVEMPLLDKLAGDMAGKLPVLTVSEDFKPELVPPFFAQKGYKNLTQWTDAAMALPPTYGASALPLTVLYDKNGKEIWRVIGGFDWASDTARKAVAEATG
jgi:thiol-disulfide isomerase/thioredoxin